MNRFFITNENISGLSITIDGDDAHHIAKVLRSKEGDSIIACDGHGRDYLCEIKVISKTQVMLDIVKEFANDTECPLDITIYQGIPKGDKMDAIIQKCVELGVNKIVPVATKRVVVKINDPSKKRQRWQKIALEAAKQCGRGIIPAIGDVMDFEELMNLDNGNLRLMPYENEKSLSIKTVLKRNPDAKNIDIFIGPEGGFDDSEVMGARAFGFEVVSMGKRILRTETAPIAAATAVLYELGDW